MSLFRKDKPTKNESPVNKQKELEKLLKERAKKEKKLQRAWKKRLDESYTDAALKAAKNILLERAYNIDEMQYEKMVTELKEHLKADKYCVPDDTDIQLKI